jgi:arginase
MRRVAMLGVPTSLGAHAPGQERCPGAFRRAGLVEQLAAADLVVDDLGDLALRRWSPDPAHPRAQHAEEVAAVARDVEAALAPVFARGDRALVVGGDCTIEVGVVAGLALSVERVGLLYVDAGADLNLPTTIREGFLDWMGMSHLLGEPGAADELAHVGSRHPLLTPADVVVVGAEPEEMTVHERRRLAELGVRVHWADEVRRAPAAAAREALAELEDRSDAILVHFDVDVIDFLDFPAADFPTINAGLRFVEAMACIDIFVGSPKWMGLTITEFNPDHVDEDEELVAAFVVRLVESLR